MIAPPVVLVLAGSDPCGGAGIQADIEAIGAAGGHAAPIITCLTVQDTRNVYEIYPVPVDLIRRQAETLLADLPIAAVKIGLLGNGEILSAVTAIAWQIPSVPLVFDPILAAGGGKSLTDDELRRRLLTELLPLTTVLTPNSPEARLLTDNPSDLDQAAKQLLAAGCQAVLLTGGHETGEEIINRLYWKEKIYRWSWQRLPGVYHGSGCTLASALAARLAKGESLETAAQQAQAYTWQSLKHGFILGKGQLIPDRFVALKK